MTATAISYGTQIWLADLAATGWQLRVVEHFTPERHVTLRLVEDDFEALELDAPARTSVGVLASKGGEGIFVPCPSEVDARDLLERVGREMEAT